MNHEERRDRKLLLHKTEIKEIVKLTRENGITLIPLELTTQNKKLKFKIAVAKGKKTHDKRESLKLKDAKREIEKFYK
jgi:SsrA-binding protein